jgi:hypothetical protein
MQLRVIKYISAVSHAINQSIRLMKIHRLLLCPISVAVAELTEHRNVYPNTNRESGCNYDRHRT